jgi:hypothetical protein
MPKLSILILLLELYLQIDGLEGNIITYIPFLEYLNDQSDALSIVSDFFNQFGGIKGYEALILAKPHLSLSPVNSIFEEALTTVYDNKF